MTPLSIGSCAEDSDAYLIAFHPSQSDLSAGNDQTSPPLIQAVEDTDYKTNEIEQNLNSLMNALTYVSGYLLRKCLIQHSCPICHHNFVTKDVNDSSLCYSACLRPLTFEGISSAGGLTMLVMFCQEADSHFAKLMRAKRIAFLSFTLIRKHRC